MNSNHASGEPYAVMLTVDAQSYSLATIDIAVELAAAVQSRLHGVFIEDEDLLRVVQLPFTHEISVPTAQKRFTDTVMMQRSLRVMAGQFRQYLARTAQASRVQWSYDYVRGRACDIGLKPEACVAYTILGQAISASPKTRRTKPTRRILLVENHSPHLANVLEIVARRFTQNEAKITVIKNANGDKSAVTGALHNGLRAFGGGSAMEIDRTQLPRMLDETGTEFDYVIVSRDEPADSLRDILRKSACPVILVS